MPRPRPPPPAAVRDLVPSLSSSTVPAATHLATYHSPYVVGPFSILVSLEPSILKC